MGQKAHSHRYLWSCRPALLVAFPAWPCGPSQGFSFSPPIRYLVQQLEDQTRGEKKSLPTPAAEKTPMSLLVSPESSTVILLHASLSASSFIGPGNWTATKLDRRSPGRPDGSIVRASSQTGWMRPTQLAGPPTQLLPTILIETARPTEQERGKDLIAEQQISRNDGQPT
jgi:hypothetical protein